MSWGVGVGRIRRACGFNVEEEVELEVKVVVEVEVLLEVDCSRVRENCRQIES